MISYCFKPELNRILLRSLVVGTLTATSLLYGLVPGLSKNSHALDFSTAAYAQAAVTDEEIRSYAQAVLAIEQLRRSAYNDIMKIIGARNLPEMECDRPASFRSLPLDARQIAQNYCDQSLALVGNYIPTSRFNEITTLSRRNGGLKQRILTELRRLQR